LLPPPLPLEGEPSLCSVAPVRASFLAVFFLEPVPAVTLGVIICPIGPILVCAGSGTSSGKTDGSSMGANEVNGTCAPGGASKEGVWPFDDGRGEVKGVIGGGRTAMEGMGAVVGFMLGSDSLPFGGCTSAANRLR